MPILQSTQCHLCHPHNANCADNANFEIHTMPIVHTMPIMSSDNANYAHNAICAIHTMPIVHTMPIMRHTQCQLCTQCHFCTQCQFCNPHNANCAHNANFAAQLALDGCIIGIVRVQNWHYLALNYCSIFLPWQLALVIYSTRFFSSSWKVFLLDLLHKWNISIKKVSVVSFHVFSNSQPDIYPVCFQMR